MATGIHATALIDPSARLDSDIRVGAYSIIDSDVEIGSGTRINSHVVIRAGTRIGRDNHIFQFTSLGDAPQDKKYQGEESKLLIGDSNVIREYCTLNRGTANGGGKTVIGNGNWFMAYVHIAHDCVIGNHTIFANGSSLAGHVEVGDYAKLSAFVLVHQFCRVGRYSFTGPATVLTQDLTPFTLASGNPAKTYSLNKEGLKRSGFDAELVAALHHCYRQLVRRRGDSGQNLGKLAQQFPEAKEFIRFVELSQRGVLR